MTIHQASAWLAVVCGAAAYALPLLLSRRYRAEFPKVLFVIPLASMLSWWLADHINLKGDVVGFTFYGAVPVAVVADLAVVLLRRSRVLRQHVTGATMAAVGLSIVIGAGMQVLLPPLTE